MNSARDEKLANQSHLTGKVVIRENRNPAQGGRTFKIGTRRQNEPQTRLEAETNEPF
jgi:hypothetical protein